MESFPPVQLGLPPAFLFQFPPSPQPRPIPAPPQPDRSWLQPFSISPKLYDTLLDARIPLTVTVLYASTAFILNKVNKTRGNKAWNCSQTKWFRTLVVLHNLFLTIYSLWTTVGMFQALRSSIPWNESGGVVAVADALCKIHGLPGLGNAALYDSSTNAWVTNEWIVDSTDHVLYSTGRLWNNGLAYFGWIFYVSKFYEVADTAIILLKGKQSSTLQIYHHTGAIMSMWTGIRYMSPPIWGFVLINSAIHALMYLYYTLSALDIRVPFRIKRLLTTMQIVQFLFGSTLATIHLFIYYPMPVVGSSQQSGQTASTTIPEARSFRGAAMADTTKNSLGYSIVRCMDTSGESFAIWFNVLYLMPLTYMFARFFIRTYLAVRRHPAPIRGGKPRG